MFFRQNEATLTICLNGKIDTNTTPDIEKDINAILDGAEFDCLELDFKQVDYISSRGLRMILSLKKKYDNLIISNENAVVYEAFHMTGLNDVIDMDVPPDYREQDRTIEHASDAQVEIADNRMPDEAFSGINDTKEDFEYCSVIEMFERQVRKNPGKTAVITPTGKITYARLNEMANRVANSLLLFGIREEDVIMILLPRGIETYIATLGVLKAGAAYTVVNVSYPEERIEYIFKDAGCKFLISDKPTVIEHLELVADMLRERPLFMDEMLANRSTYSPGIRNREHDLCYLIYTSGSTGNPKGVMIEHGNLSNFVYPTSKNHESNGITSRCKVLLAMAQMTFDISIMEEYLALTSGITIAMATEEEILNPLKMKDFMLRCRVDGVVFTPAYANTVASIPEMREALANIVTYDVGSEAFPGALYDKLHAISPNALIMNGYGPTETTISCTMKVVESSENITIGRPNANVYAFVVDEELNELPRGEVGELVICGLGVGRGYVNLPEKTRETFINFKGMRGYRTGDLACINEKDEIEFHGRRDNQVKLKGLRIELDEVERAIAHHPDVKLAAVRVFDNRILVGYYQLQNKEKVSTDEMKEFVSRSLAHYMIPDVFVEMEEMPLTNNNKIDRKALPRPEVKEEVVPPQNETQEKILTVVQKVFEGINIGITTNLHELGLSSLDAMLLSSSLAEEFDVNVQFSDINNNSTIAELEKMVLSKSNRSKKEMKDSYRIVEALEPLVQEILEEDNNMNFNLPCLLTMSKEIDASKLQKAVSSVLSKHESLWAGFEERDNVKYILRNKEHGDYYPEITEITEAEFAKLKAKLKRPFYYKDLLFRAEIFVTEAHVYLFTDFHHVISDGDSIEIFIDEVIRTYQGESIENETYSVFDQHSECEQFVENGGMAKIYAYYDELLAGVKYDNNMLKDKNDEQFALNVFRRKLAFTADELSQKAKSLHISPSVLMMGLSAIYLGNKAKGNDIEFLNTFNGRNDSRKWNTIADLAVLCPFAVNWKHDTTLREFYTSLQRQAMLVMGLQEHSFNYLYINYPKILEFGYAYLEEKDEYIIDGKTAECELLAESGSGGLFGIYEEIVVNNKEVFFNAEYRSNEYEEDSIKDFADNLERLFTLITPDSTVGNLLSIEEKV
ncbi:MAG: amino acid adenylation domain-containing protein [Eubacteriales bacterium]|nr:amino acid adenylation domain-containing protein [Eubacteriales bacterium]